MGRPSDVVPRPERRCFTETVDAVTGDIELHPLQVVFDPAPYLAAVGDVAAVLRRVRRNDGWVSLFHAGMQRMPPDFTDCDLLFNLRFAHEPHMGCCRVTGRTGRLTFSKEGRTAIAEILSYITHSDDTMHIRCCALACDTLRRTASLGAIHVHQWGGGDFSRSGSLSTLRDALMAVYGKRCVVVQAPWVVVDTGDPEFWLVGCARLGLMIQRRATAAGVLGLLLPEPASLDNLPRGDSAPERIRKIVSGGKFVPTQTPQDAAEQLARLRAAGEDEPEHALALAVNLLEFYPDVPLRNEQTYRDVWVYLCGLAYVRKAHPNGITPVF